MAQQNNSLFSKVQVWLPLMLGAVLAGGIFLGSSMQPQYVVVGAEGASAQGGQGSRVEELLRYIDAKYVEEPNDEQIVRKAIGAIVGELDPHSSYIPVEELEAINEQLEGNFDGIGVEFMMLDDTIVVVTPLSGGPSEAVGIQAGDKIVSIEDSIVAGLPLTTSEIFGFLRGEKGTKVDVGVKRFGHNDLLDFTITRAEIPMHSVDVAMMLDEQTGFIKVNRFSATTYDEFVQSLEKLVEKQGMRDLIIDLRHNPGGYLTKATSMLSQLFPEKGKLLVYTEGRSVKRTEYTTNGRPFYRIGNVVVLIDEGSASASEIMAGAIQDHDRGVVIGRRSFGKGLVQEQYGLRDGSALRLTVARYYTPSGRCIQKAYDEAEDNYDNDVEERFLNGELSDEGNISIADSTQFFTASGHVVYGGGGIVPDVFVPLDTFYMNESYLRWRQHVSAFSFRYLEQNGKEKPMEELSDFVAQFDVDAAIYSDFLAYGSAQNEDLAVPTKQRVQTELKKIIKARLARQYYGPEGFFAVFNASDNMIDEALRILKTDDPLSSAREIE